MSILVKKYRQGPQYYHNFMLEIDFVVKLLRSVKILLRNIIWLIYFNLKINR